MSSTPTHTKVLSWLRQQDTVRDDINTGGNTDGNEKPPVTQLENPFSDKSGLTTQETLTDNVTWCAPSPSLYNLILVNNSATEPELVSTEHPEVVEDFWLPADLETTEYPNLMLTNEWNEDNDTANDIFYTQGISSSPSVPDDINNPLDNFYTADDHQCSNPTSLPTQVDSNTELKVPSKPGNTGNPKHPRRKTLRKKRIKKKAKKNTKIEDSQQTSISTATSTQQSSHDSTDDKILDQFIEEEASHSIKESRSEATKFALWALNNLLPERKGLDDKANILHAAADYIEGLLKEIKNNMQRLGMSEEMIKIELENFARPTTSKSIRKSRKKEHDSGEVRRPPNAFIRFSVEFRRVVAEDFPGRNNRDISQMLGSIWRRMSCDEKRPYISEFYADLEKTRQQHPGWNYAGINSKRFCPDLGQTQPERLRPRDPNRYSSYKFSREYSKDFKNRKVKKERKNTPVEEQEFWAQCDLCNKWRKLPQSIGSVNLPEKWSCSLNPDPQHNSCDAPEETD